MLREPIGIRGLATWLPDGRVDAATLASWTGGQWTAEAIEAKLGIEEKVVAGPEDGVQEMGARAARRCLERAGIDALEVDAILCIGDELREYPMTTSGIYIQEAIGARNAWAVDVMQKCSSFAAGVRVARALMWAEPKIRRVLLAGGYRNGDMIDYQNPRVSFMYNLAPGGGAILLERGFSANEITGVALRSDGALARHVLAHYGGTVNPVAPDNASDVMRCLDVTDQASMRRLLGERSLPNFLGVIDDALAEGGQTRQDIDYLALLHMKRSGHREILDALNLTEDQSIYLSSYGHIGQFDQILSLDLALHEGRVAKGDLVVGVGAGIGYSWGAVAIRWGESQREQTIDREAI